MTVVNKISLPPVGSWLRDQGVGLKGAIGIGLDESQHARDVIANANSRMLLEFEGDLTDSKGSNDGTAINGAGLTAAGRGLMGSQALSLDGVNQYVTCGADPSLDVEDGAFTLAGLIRPDFWTEVGKQYVIFTSSDNPSFGYALVLNRGAGADVIPRFDLIKLGLVDQHIPCNFPSYEYDKRAVIFHMVQNHNGSNPTFCELFLNKVSQGTFAHTGAYISGAGRTAQIGFLNSVGMDYYKGLIDSLAIYDKALSQAEITVDYNNRYSASSPTADSQFFPTPLGTLAAPALELLINEIATLLGVSTGTVKLQYATNDGALNGTFVTLATAKAGLLGTVITDDTKSMRLLVQFISDGSQGSDIVVASYVSEAVSSTSSFNLPLEAVKLPALEVIER